MELVHLITLEKSGELSHALYSIENVDKFSKDHILMMPCKMSFNTFWFASLRAHDVDLGDNVIFNNDWMVVFSISIVDDLEKKPLLKGQSSTRSILLLGEILRNITEALVVFGLKAPFFMPKPKTNCMDINFTVPKGSSLYQALGSAMGLITVIDSLLFERGLLIHSSEVLISDQQILEQQLFVTLYKQILASINVC